MPSARVNPVQVGFSDDQYKLLHRAAKLRGISPSYLVYLTIREALPSLQKAVEASEDVDRQVAQFMARVVSP